MTTLVQSYIHILEESFLSLVRDDEESFQEFFPIAFHGAMTAVDRIVKDLKDLYWESAATLRADVLIDIIEIGSYAKFMAEYRDNQKFWEVCVTTWDSFLAAHENPEEVTEFVTSMVRFKQQHIMMSPRSICRMHWQQVLNSFLNNEGSLKDSFYNPHYGYPQPHPHKSKLVRKVCSTFGMGVHWPGPDVFMFAYFENHRRPKEPLDLRDNHGIRRALFERHDPIVDSDDEYEE